MLERMSSLIDTINYINKNDHSQKINIKFLNSTMCVVFTNEIGMSKVDLTSKEELDKVLEVLNYKKEALSEMTVTKI